MENIECEEVDVTRENGLFHSVLKPSAGLIRDLIRGLEKTKWPMITAMHVGHNKKAMALGDNGRSLIILNPVIESLSGNCKKSKYYRKIRISYVSFKGNACEDKFKGRDAELIQAGLEILSITRKPKRK